VDSGTVLDLAAFDQDVVTVKEKVDKTPRNTAPLTFTTDNISSRVAPSMQHRSNDDQITILERMLKHRKTKVTDLLTEVQTLKEVVPVDAERFQELYLQVEHGREAETRFVTATAQLHFDSEPR
jgi:hypothetical protein